LGLIKGDVEKLPPLGQIPHVGWESTELVNKSGAFQSLNSKHDFYFVHSYHFRPLREEDVLARTKFENSEFASGVIHKNVLGVQFHPEKSGKAGSQFLSEIISWAEGKSD
jgi:imidazole glycerol phosphate synthase glutamine amidotransferase subunit